MKTLAEIAADHTNNGAAVALARTVQGHMIIEIDTHSQTMLWDIEKKVRADLRANGHMDAVVDSTINPLFAQRTVRARIVYYLPAKTT